MSETQEVLQATDPMALESPSVSTESSHGLDDVTASHRAPKKPSAFKTWEVLLIALGALIFGASATMYFSGWSPRSWLLGESQDESGLSAVGSVAKVSGGGLKRQSRLESGFTSLKSSAAVHNGDTLMTADDGEAVIELKDGSSLNLGPGTLVRLTTESSVGLTGVSRSASLDVVKGQVSGDSASAGALVVRSADKVTELKKGANEAIKVAAVPIVKPAPRVAPAKVLSSSGFGGSDSFSAAKLAKAPEVAAPVAAAAPLSGSVAAATKLPSLAPDFDVKWIKPVTGSKLATPTGAEVKLPLEWQLIKGAPETQLRVYFGKDVTPVFEKKWKSEESATQTQTEFIAKKPGEYRFELEAGSKKVETQAFVEPTFKGLTLLPVRIAGSEDGTNALKDKLIDQPLEATLSWKPVGKVRPPYRLKIFRPGVSTPIVDTSLATESYTLKGKDLVEGALSYRVEARAVAGGFIPVSETQTLDFRVVPPTPARPKSGSAFSLASLKKSQGSFLMTWVVTNFTESYEIEVGTGAPGSAGGEILQAKDNFLVYKPKQAGNYWWRVRGVTQGKKSVWSESQTFVIQP